MRSKVSKKNNYYIPKERYLELKHFCLQYPDWVRAYCIFCFQPAQTRMTETKVVNVYIHDFTDFLPGLDELKSKIDLVDKTANETDEFLSSYILKSVTQGISYDSLNARESIPCCRNVFYKTQRKFFWLLDQKTRHEQIRN